MRTLRGRRSCTGRRTTRQPGDPGPGDAPHRSGHSSRAYCRAAAALAGRSGVRSFVPCISRSKERRGRSRRGSGSAGGTARGPPSLVSVLPRRAEDADVTVPLHVARLDVREVVDPLQAELRHQLLLGDELLPRNVPRTKISMSGVSGARTRPQSTAVMSTSFGSSIARRCGAKDRTHGLGTPPQHPARDRQAARHARRASVPLGRPEAEATR